MSALDDAVRAAASRELPRRELSGALVERLEALDAPAESVAAARKIAAPESVVVVAGQQPVLFGGPGLVWAKACDALSLARAIEERHGVPAVAVFWNAAEDHDHAECDHVGMELGAATETLRVPLPGDRRMLSRVPAPAEARALLDGLRTKFPQGPSRDEILAALEPAADDTMGTWFSRILLRLLGRRGLVVVEPETLRPFAKNVVEFEVSRPGELAAIVRRAETDESEAEHAPPLELVRDELFFLLDDAGRRLRVEREGASWRVQDGRVLSTAALLALPPSAFSWNVAGRVLAQDLALPVAAQICGPTEIRYCRVLATAHGPLGVPAPFLVRRTDWLFTTPPALRLARRLGVGPADVAMGTYDAPAPEPADPAEAEALRDLVGRLPGGSAAVQRRRASLVRGVEAYVEARRRDDADRVSVGGARMARLSAMLRPGGEPQDRALSPLPWLAQMGLRSIEDSWSVEDFEKGRMRGFEVAAPPSENS